MDQIESLLKEIHENAKLLAKDKNLLPHQGSRPKREARDGNPISDDESMISKRSDKSLFFPQLDLRTNKLLTDPKEVLGENTKLEKLRQLENLNEFLNTINISPRKADDDLLMQKRKRFLACFKRNKKKKKKKKKRNKLWRKLYGRNPQYEPFLEENLPNLQ